MDNDINVFRMQYIANVLHHYVRFSVSLTFHNIVLETINNQVIFIDIFLKYIENSFTKSRVHCIV